MNTEKGQNVQRAIKAVCQMHKEVSKLLVDFDTLVPWPCESVFGNFATRELTYHVRTRQWMAEAVYRYLASKTEPGLVEALTVCFTDPPTLTEPVLLLGRIQYSVDGKSNIACEEWDLWDLYFTWNTDCQVGIPKDCEVPQDSRIKCARVMGVPLYSISSLSAVGEYLAQLRVAKATA